MRRNLPTYPPANVRKSLSASQLATLNLNLSDALAHILVQPLVDTRASANASAFLSSYVNDFARQYLQSLIWQNPINSADNLHKRVFLLANLLSTSLDAKTLLDISIAYFPYQTRVRALFASALDNTPTLSLPFASDLLPALTALLTPSRSTGLYVLRKTARCVLSLLSACPPALVRPFASSQDFIIALAQAYDSGLTSLARSYGGLRADANANADIPPRELDDWERIWLETKIDLMDSFHILMKLILLDLSLVDAGARSECTFGIVFALLDLPSPSPSPPAQAQAGTPFLNRSLLADYQHSYDLAQTLIPALRLTACDDDDARICLLESTFRSYDMDMDMAVASSSVGTKDPGALKLIIKSSFPAPTATATTNTTTATTNFASRKGKSKSDLGSFAPNPSRQHDREREREQERCELDLDLQISQVLDIFPDQSPAYIRALLVHPAFPDAEKVIEALLEGTAPREDLLIREEGVGAFDFDEPTVTMAMERRNVFDDEVLDVTKIHVGKKNQDEEVQRDRTAVEQMKADILRRAEAMLNVEDEDQQGRKAVEIDDEVAFGFGDGGDVRVVGDGEASGGDEGEDSDNNNDSDDEKDKEGASRSKLGPETILEMAYIRDSALFNRDANTRRSKARGELKIQTGWTDEQIEGWKIMLERNPRKDEILLKHEFSGNRAESVDLSGVGSSSRERGRGGGRGGGGRGAAQGRGRGRGSGVGGGGGGDAKQRAWKDKQKASRANHDRKKGHDKKMAKAGL